MTAPSNRLPPVLGAWALALFAVGWTIATAIYRVPGEVAKHAGSAPVALALWVVGAVAALSGALCYAELATRCPRSGGDYVFLRAGWGDAPAFLYGWTMLWAGPATVAAVATVFADYLGTIVALSPVQHGIAAAGVVLFHTALAARSTRTGTGVISGGGVLKVGALLLIVALAFLKPAAHAAAAIQPAIPFTLGGIGLAQVAVIWAFDGFLGGSSMAGEVHDPHRNIPRGFVAGALILTAVYLLANLAYFHTLGFLGVAQSTTVAADTMQAVAGGTGRAFVAVLVTGSAFISVGAILMGNSRVIFAMAEDGLFFAPFGKVSRWRTPAVAIATLGSVATVLALLGSYGLLIRWAVLGFYPLGAMSALGLMRMRRMNPQTTGYAVPWYPLPLVLWVTTIGATVALALLGDPWAVAGAAGLAALGFVAFRMTRSP
ncbi:MAG: amino acid permease [Gemmatimonadetes bacterium]|nr:amino acid permease [Gemmatimonadota bacterium]